MRRVFVAPDAACPKLVVGKLNASVSKSWVEWPGGTRVLCTLHTSMTLNGSFGLNIWQTTPFDARTPLDSVVDIAVLPDMCTYPIIFEPADETATGIRIVRELTRANNAAMIGSKTAQADTSVYEYSSRLSGDDDDTNKSSTTTPSSTDDSRPASPVVVPSSSDDDYSSINGTDMDDESSDEQEED